MTTSEQEFDQLARAIELLIAAINAIEMTQRLLGPSRVLDVALQCCRYVLSNLNETDAPRN